MGCLGRCSSVGRRDARRRREQVEDGGPIFTSPASNRNVTEQSEFAKVHPVLLQTFNPIEPLD